MDSHDKSAVTAEPALRLFLLLWGTVCGAAALVPLVVRLLEPIAVSPWEAQIAMEGIRFNAGLPLYEPGHATHLYGPLLSLMLGIIFKVAGLNLVLARMVFSIAGIALTFLLAGLVCRTKSRIWLLALFFLALNWRTNFVFYSTQPDCLAALLGIAGLLVWLGRDASSLRYALALVLWLGAMLFKQTSAAFALIPLVHELIWERPPQGQRLLVAMIPPAFLFLVLMAVAVMWPQLFSGMVVVPAKLKVHYDQFAPMLVYLLGTFPLFFLGLFGLLLTNEPLSKSERWIVSANVVLIPISVWTAVKSGGGLNSLLFAYLAMAAFVISQLERFFTIGKFPGRHQLIALGSIFLALLCSLFFQYQNSLSILFLRLGDDKYERAVAVARNLGPGVVSPQDTTIAFRANGYIGRSVFLELDGHSENGDWPPLLPESIRQELAGAKHVIEIQCYVPTPVFHDALQSQGFERAPVPAFENSVYTLWARKN
jgi:hypothetical protein